MATYTLKCPSCGANISLEGEHKKAYCPYCGTQVLIDDGVVRQEIVHRYVDEAEIIKAKQELEIEKLRAKSENSGCLFKVLVAILLFAVLAFTVWYLYANYSMPALP